MKKWLMLIALLLPVTAQAAFNVQEVTSGENKAWLVREPVPPVFTLKLAFKGAGSAHDEKGREGRANFAAQLFTEGAGKYDAQAFKRELERYAVRLSMYPDEDNLYVTLETLSENKDKAVELLLLALTEARFAASDVERVRQETLSAIRLMKQNPGYVAEERWRQLAFAAHGYGKPGRGTEQSVGALRIADLKSYASGRITSDAMLAGAAGDVDPDTLTQILTRLQKALPKADKAPPELADVAIQEGDGIVTIDMDIPQTTVKFGLNGLARSDARYYAAHLFNYILGGGDLTTRMMVELREKHGLVYSAHSYLDPMRHAPLWRGAFASANAKVKEAMERTLAQFAEIAANGVTEAELEDAKNYVTGSFALGLDSNDALAGMLISMQYYNLGIDYLAHRNEYMRGVTRDQVNAVAKFLLAEHRPIVVMVGKPEGDMGKLNRPTP